MTWKKILTRTMPVISMYYPVYLYAKVFKDTFGEGFDRNLCIFKNGLLHSYRHAEDAEKFFEHLRKISLNLDLTKKNIQLGLEYTDNLLNFLKEFEKKDLSSLDKNQLLSLFEKFNKIYFDYWTYYAFAFYLGHAWENDPKKVINKFQKELDILRRDPTYLKAENMFFKPFCREVTKRAFGKESDLLLYAVPDEILGFLKGKKELKREIYEERTKHFTLLTGKGKVKIFSGEESKNLEKEELKEESPLWYMIVKRLRCPLINSIMIDGMTHFYRKDHPIDYALKHFIFVDGYWYANENYENKKRVEIEEKLKGDNRFLLKIMKSAYSEWKSFEVFLKKTNFDELSTGEIAEYYNKINRFLLEWNGRFLQFMWLPEKIVERKIKDFVDSQEEFLLLTSPCREGFFEQENRKLLQIVSKIQTNKKYIEIFKKENEDVEKELSDDKELKNILLNHLNEFSWLANTNFNSTFWDIENLIQRIKGILGDDITVRLEELDKTKKEREDKIRKLISKLQFNEQEKSLIETTRELVYFRSFRTDIQWKTGYYVYQLFQEIATRMGISIEDFHYLTYFEISAFLENDVLDKEMITKRKHRYAMIAEDGEINYFYDEKKIDEIKQIVESKEEMEIKELKGSMASPGVVQGKVKVIHSVEDLSKIKPGNILVTSMTKPDYIIAMEKAAAFVTDEGGILCHAAIIAREMNKPCVIGTEKATKIFYDDDIVEVNADKGIIRKIK